MTEDVPPVMVRTELVASVKLPFVRVGSAPMSLAARLVPLIL